MFLSLYSAKKKKMADKILPQRVSKMLGLVWQLPVATAVLIDSGCIEF